MKGENEALRLRPAVERDADEYARLRNGEETFKWFFSRRRFTEAEVKSWIRGLDSKKEEVFLAESDGQIVGTCSIHDIRPSDQSCELGRIIVDESMRRRGLGEKMLELLVGRCRALGMKTLRANIMKENTASLRLFERAGFRVVEERPETGWYLEREA